MFDAFESENALDISPLKETHSEGEEILQIRQKSTDIEISKMRQKPQDNKVLNMTNKYEDIEISKMRQKREMKNRKKISMKRMSKGRLIRKREKRKRKSASRRKHRYSSADTISHVKQSSPMPHVLSAPELAQDTTSISSFPQGLR